MACNSVRPSAPAPQVLESCWYAVLAIAKLDTKESALKTS